MSSYIENKPDVVLIAGIPIKVVYSNTHTLGNVAVGHAVGKGVRLNQNISSEQPEQIQLRCAFLSNDKYYYKFALEQLHNLKVPFPFVSKLTALPFVTITSLVFTQSSNRKSIEDGNAVIDFSIVLTEHKINYFIKLGVKLAWLTWTLATYADRASGSKLYTSIPSIDNLTAVSSTSYMQASIIADKTLLGFGLPTTTTAADLIKYNKVNKRFSLIPFSNNATIPQSVKLQYPVSSEYYIKFNESLTINSTYTGYYMTASKSAVSKYITFTLIAKQVDSTVSTTLIVYDENNTELFARKVFPNVIYGIGKYQIVFNSLVIDPKSINNAIPTSVTTKIEGGIRPL